MPVPDSLVLASEVIGFLSFGFTLLTAIGVYADLIKTLRSAPSAIPIALGNLREEIRYEQLLCKQDLATHDPFHVLPVRKSRGRKHRDVARLAEGTVRHLWMEFCDIERDFLVDGESRSANLDSDNDYDDDNEKSSAHRRRKHTRPKPTNRESFVKGRMGWIEAGLSRDRQTYYNTDLTHRFRWWWRKDDVDSLAHQLQRIQIRRIERDSYETSELVKRGLKFYGQTYDVDVFEDSDSSSDRGGRGGGGSDSDNVGGGGGGKSGAAGVVHAHKRRHRRTPSSQTNNRRRSRNGSNPYSGMREVSEKEIIRRRAPSPMERTLPRRSTSVANARRERPARASVVYEYEIVDPGGIHVEYENPRQEGRQRSYSRPRTGGG